MAIKKTGQAKIQPKKAEAVFRKWGFDSIEEMLKVYQDPATSDKVAADLLKELAQYQYSKMPRAVADEVDTNRISQERAAEMRARLKELSQN